MSLKSRIVFVTSRQSCLFVFPQSTNNNNDALLLLFISHFLHQPNKPLLSAFMLSVVLSLFVFLLMYLICFLHQKKKKTYLCQYFFNSTSGFNAAVAGCFFAIETVLRPLRAENSPPFTTAMIILASVISSTVSNVLLGERPAFTVPTYELKSAAGTLSYSDSA